MKIAVAASVRSCVGAGRASADSRRRRARQGRHRHEQLHGRRVRVEAVHPRPSGQAREIDFTTFQKVPDKRLVRFSSPGDLEGHGRARREQGRHVRLSARLPEGAPRGHARQSADLHGLGLLVRGHVAVALLADLRRQAGQGGREFLGARPDRQAGAGDRVPAACTCGSTRNRPSRPRSTSCDAGGKVLKTAEYFDYHIDGAQRTTGRRRSWSPTIAATITRARSVRVARS